MEEIMKILRETKKHVMTGISYMIPFVVTGGVVLVTVCPTVTSASSWQTPSPSA